MKITHTRTGGQNYTGNVWRSEARNHRSQGRVPLVLERFHTQRRYKDYTRDLSAFWRGRIA